MTELNEIVPPRWEEARKQATHFRTFTTTKGNKHTMFYTIKKVKYRHNTPQEYEEEYPAYLTCFGVYDRHSCRKHEVKVWGQLQPIEELDEGT